MMRRLPAVSSRQHPAAVGVANVGVVVLSSLFSHHQNHHHEPTCHCHSHHQRRTFYNERISLPPPPSSTTSGSGNNSTSSSHHLYERARTSLLQFNMMLDAGLRPDVLTYTALIDAMGRAGLEWQAFRLFAQLVDQHQKGTTSSGASSSVDAPLPETYAALLNATKPTRTKLRADIARRMQEAAHGSSNDNSSRHYLNNSSTSFGAVKAHIDDRQRMNGSDATRLSSQFHSSHGGYVSGGGDGAAIGGAANSAANVLAAEAAAAVHAAEAAVLRRMETYFAAADDENLLMGAVEPTGEPDSTDDHRKPTHNAMEGDVKEDDDDDGGLLFSSMLDDDSLQYASHRAMGKNEDKKEEKGREKEAASTTVPSSSGATVHIDHPEHAWAVFQAHERQHGPGSAHRLAGHSTPSTAVDDALPFLKTAPTSTTTDSGDVKKEKGNGADDGQQTQSHLSSPSSRQSQHDQLPPPPPQYAYFGAPTEAGALARRLLRLHPEELNTFLAIHRQLREPLPDPPALQIQHADSTQQLSSQQQQQFVYQSKMQAAHWVLVDRVVTTVPVRAVLDMLERRHRYFRAVERVTKIQLEHMKDNINNNNGNGEMDDDFNNDDDTVGGVTSPSSAPKVESTSSSHDTSLERPPDARTAWETSPETLYTPWGAIRRPPLRIPHAPTPLPPPAVTSTVLLEQEEQQGGYTEVAQLQTQQHPKHPLLENENLVENDDHYDVDDSGTVVTSTTPTDVAVPTSSSALTTTSPAPVLSLGELTQPADIIEAVVAHVAAGSTAELPQSLQRRYARLFHLRWSRHEPSSLVDAVAWHVMNILPTVVDLNNNNERDDGVISKSFSPSSSPSSSSLSSVQAGLLRAAPTLALKLRQEERRGMQQTIEAHEAMRIISRYTHNLQVTDGGAEINTSIARADAQQRRAEEFRERDRRKAANVADAAALRLRAATTLHRSSNNNHAMNPSTSSKKQEQQHAEDEAYGEEDEDLYEEEGQRQQTEQQNRKNKTQQQAAQQKPIVYDRRVFETPADFLAKLHTEEQRLVHASRRVPTTVRPSSTYSAAATAEDGEEDEGVMIGARVPPRKAAATTTRYHHDSRSAASHTNANNNSPYGNGGSKSSSHYERTVKERERIERRGGQGQASPSSYRQGATSRHSHNDPSLSSSSRSVRGAGTSPFPSSSTEASAVEELPPWALGQRSQPFNVDTGRFGRPDEGRLMELADGHIRLMPQHESLGTYRSPAGLLPGDDFTGLAQHRVHQTVANQRAQEQQAFKRQFHRYRRFEKRFLSSATSHSSHSSAGVGEEGEGEGHQQEQWRGGGGNRRGESGNSGGGGRRGGPVNFLFADMDASSHSPLSSSQSSSRRVPAGRMLRKGRDVMPINPDRMRHFTRPQ